MRRAIALALVLTATSACTMPNLLHRPAVTLGPHVAVDQIPGPPSDSFEARVTRVVDGDTIVLTNLDVGYVDHQTAGRHARLIGIDTPEVFGSVGCYGHIASDFTRRTLLGKTVRVDYDLNKVDRFGRALVYVWGPDGSFFNAQLAGQGYAMQETVPPNVRYVDLFSRLVTEARNRNLGLWRAC